MYYQILLLNSMDKDFQIIKRVPEGSSKYLWASKTQPDVDISKALPVNTADMQFKFSPAIYKKLIQKLGDTPHFGYANPRQSFWDALTNWIQSRYYRQIQPLNPSNTTLWNNTVSSFQNIIEALTTVNDQILMFSPSYYFYLNVLNYKKRKMIEYQYDQEQGRFYIDFEKLQVTFKKNNIKLIVFGNPMNPCGRIWSKQELKKLSQLVVKYKILFLSNQIYSDSIEPTEEQAKEGLSIIDVFNSMLSLEQIYPYLIYISSYTKTFNCSGVALGYSICFNDQIFRKLLGQSIHSGAFPNCIALQLLQIFYTSEQANLWRKNLIQYLRRNFKLFKQLCKQKLPLLKIYDLQCSYLCLVDFKAYGLAGQKLKQKFTSVNVWPTFMESFYVDQKERSVIRINLGLNQKLVVELVDRMKQMIDRKSE